MGRYKGSRCIVPKCNSEYDSNTEKCHRFSVPFEEEVLLKWVKAIPRKDFVMKGGMVVCEKHFLHNFLRIRFQREKIHMKIIVTFFAQNSRHVLFFRCLSFRPSFSRFSLYFAFFNART